MIGALALMAVPAQAQEQRFELNMPSQRLDSALRTFARQSRQQLIFAVADTKGFNAPALNGSYSADEAIQALLAGTGLEVRRNASGVLLIGADTDPQGGSAEEDGADVEALIVTAQKREEAIQDVPIAISAFTQKALEEQKIEGGFDLLKAIPNVTFSKSNFTSYNFSIRGVGTKAVSATTDPGVAVSFNNTALIQNRLFEQEYFDVERVEVLRGPQGTLYGRNATSGVINVISAKPDLGAFDGWVKGEVGNFHSKRVSAMVNVPIIEDRLAVRFAGSLTNREGYDYNTVTKNAVNGRDLWSGRITVGFEPTERLRGNLIWERFNEDDNRSRTGKQLCHRQDGPTYVGGVNVTLGARPELGVSADARRAIFGQGCQGGSLYDDAAYGTPNGLSYTFVLGAFALTGVGASVGTEPGSFQQQSLLLGNDPYGGAMQSADLREIASIRDPIYRASADLFALDLNFDITPSITLVSQTAYNKDETYSFQDYNRFSTLPVFRDTGVLNAQYGSGPSAYRYLAPGGIFCDPQIGCSNTLAGFDISRASGKQFSQEFRLQSSFDGNLNFSAGMNYTKFETLVDYYVMYNLITALSHLYPFNNAWAGGDPQAGLCDRSPFQTLPAGVPTENSACVYIDPNPLESINGEGHNYFRSKNPYKLESSAAFGEVYWNASDAVKITAGLRYTDDAKSFIPVPSQTLLNPSVNSGGLVSKGYPEKPAINQEWGELTGRLGIDWQPTLSFTDQTLLYAFYSRGYKGGGANPPTPGFATAAEYLAGAEAAGASQVDLDYLADDRILPVLSLTAVEYGSTFAPEFVDSFEIGAKSTLLDGVMTFNATAFYYDYKDYQVSQIRDRTAVNENFDAKIWGLEFETTLAPTRNLRINANLGYLDSEIADGATSIDIMDRAQGDPNYTVVKPWMQLPSNCVVPTHVAAAWARTNSALAGYWTMCGGVKGGVDYYSGSFAPDPVIGGRYNVANYPELNGGAGLKADLGGNELPNAPHWTANLGGQYGMDLLDGSWRATFRGDAYWQSQSFHRVYNTEYDKLHGWYNVNLSMWLEKPDTGLKIEFYVKNLLDATPITDAFLNSDDTGLTTNVFTLDPRLIGLSVRKGF